MRPGAQAEAANGVQAGWGLFTGVVVYATAFGGLLALVLAAVDRRAVPLGPRA